VLILINQFFNIKQKEEINTVETRQIELSLFSKGSNLTQKRTQKTIKNFLPGKITAV
jgi:hypothetical protein